MSDKSSKQAILVPVDFSPYSEVAILKACELSSCINIPIVILHVVHDPSQFPGYYAKLTKKKHLVRIEDVAKEMFDEFMQEMIKTHPKLTCLTKAKSKLVTGLPVSRILEVAEQINARMIVMGSQGRTGLNHMMLGSKAEQIVRLSPIPVTIVKVKVKGALHAAS